MVLTMVKAHIYISVGYKDKYLKCSQKFFQFREVVVLGSPTRAMKSLALASSQSAKFLLLGMLSFSLNRPFVQLESMGAKDKSSRVLVSSYCCSTYRVAVPYSSLGNFSSSSIRGRVTHPIADCDYPILCLLGPGIFSQERAISGSFQRNLASVCNGVRDFLKTQLSY